MFRDAAILPRGEAQSLGLFERAIPLFACFTMPTYLALWADHERLIVCRECSSYSLLVHMFRYWEESKLAFG